MGAKQNPSNEQIKSARAADVSMSAPVQQLDVPEIEGYVLHWFADRPGRIPRAASIGWQFVETGEVNLNNFGFAADVMNESGNTDLGTRVSLHGGVNENGQSERLYLMKIQTDLWEKGQKVLEERNESIAASIRGGTIGAGDASTGETSGDARLRYLKTKATMFLPKHNRRP
jgi:hypothetical protein